MGRKKPIFIDQNYVDEFIRSDSDIVEAVMRERLFGITRDLRSTTDPIRARHLRRNILVICCAADLLIGAKAGTLLRRLVEHDLMEVGQAPSMEGRQAPPVMEPEEGYCPVEPRQGHLSEVVPSAGQMDRQQGSFISASAVLHPYGGKAGVTHTDDGTAVGVFSEQFDADGWKAGRADDHVVTPLHEAGHVHDHWDWHPLDDAAVKPSDLVRSEQRRSWFRPLFTSRRRPIPKPGSLKGH